MITFPTLPQDPPKTLVEARILHTRCLCRLEAFAEDSGIYLVHAEGYVLFERKGRLVRPAAGTSAVVVFTDAVHMKGSVHYEGLGRDHVVYQQDPKTLTYLPVSDGGAPVWKQLGEFWKGLHPSCRWGGDFTTVDANHFSIAWGGVA